MNSPISLFLVDDHRIFSQSFQAYVSTQPSFSWKGAADGTGRTAMEIMRFEPDVLLLDFHLREKNGVELLRELRHAGYKGLVVMLTMNRDEQVRSSARTAGANGFVSKDADGAEMLEGISRLFRGEVDFLQMPLEGIEPAANPYKLTRQERMIASLVCGGLNSEAISKKLDISIHTVHTHRRRILEKTDSGSFMEVCNKLT